MYKAMI